MSDFPSSPIYLIADTGTCRGDRLVAAVSAAVAAGVKLVQYRHKGALTGACFAEARALAQVARDAGAHFIINDRIDLALEVGADGVHLGQDDLPVAVARDLMPGGALVGVSTHDPAEAAGALEDGADYIGFGNVFGTRSKADAGDPRGVAALAEVCGRVPLPVFAIGGVNGDNLAQVKAAGAAGGALISAILGADDPGQATAELMARWKAAP